MSGAAKYRVEYRRGAAGAWVEDDTGETAITGTSHTVDGLYCGTSHGFRVSAFGDDTTGGCGLGPASTVTTASTAVCPLPAAPTNLAAGTVAATSVPLTWNEVTGAAKYRVEYRRGDPFSWIARSYQSPARAIRSPVSVATPRMSSG